MSDTTPTPDLKTQIVRATLTIARAHWIRTGTPIRVEDADSVAKDIAILNIAPPPASEPAGDADAAWVLELLGFSTPKYRDARAALARILADRAGLRKWRDAVIEACVVNFVEWSEDAVATLAGLVRWERGEAVARAERAEAELAKAREALAFYADF